MTKFSLFSTAALFALATSSAFATQEVCPIVTGGNTGVGQGVSSTYTTDAGGPSFIVNAGCNVLITFNADGSITTTHPNAAPSFDGGGEDVIVGIINNTGAALPSVTLSATTTPFEFDGDGLCDHNLPTPQGTPPVASPYGWTFSASGAGGAAACGGATSGYGPTGVTFSGIATDFDTGTVNFSGGIAGGGGSGYFSLEGPVSLLKVVSSVPEPSSIVLFGTLAGALFLRLKKRTQNS